jgi:hypothetical protein
MLLDLKGINECKLPESHQDNQTAMEKVMESVWVAQEQVVRV